MTLPALLAVLLCAVSFSGLDLLRKLLAGRVRPMPLLVFLALGAAPAFALWWGTGAAAGPGEGYWLPGGGSVVLNIFANLAMLQAVRVSPLSLTIPLLSLTPVFTTLLAVPLLGELPSRWEATGIVLVVVGALRLNLGSGAGGRSPRAFLRAFTGEPGTLLMVAVALLWSLAMPLDKMAMNAASPAFHGLALNLGVGAGTLAGLVVAGRVRELAAPGGRDAGLIAAAIAVSVTALAFQLIAMTLIPVGLVETLKRGLGNLAAVVLGRAVFGEGVTAAKLVGVGLMAVGVGLVVLG